MPKTTLYSASQIAAMRLPGLPTTKARVIERASSEGWAFEEQTGLGGKRRMYAVPARYLTSGERDQSKASELLDEATRHVGERRAAGELDDGDLIQEVVMGVEMWLSRNNLQADPKRKAALVALLYRYFREEGNIDAAKLDKLLRAVA